MEQFANKKEQDSISCSFLLLVSEKNLGPRYSVFVLIHRFYSVVAIASISRSKSAGNMSPILPILKVSCLEIFPG